MVSIRHKSRTARRLARFLRDEDGALIPLALQIFLVMMICTGISIDFVRQEERRTKIQNTLDRAALAAASLSQELDPTLVVEDYLKKAGLEYLDATPDVQQGTLNEWRRVTINATDNMHTIFGSLININTLQATGSSTAQEEIGNVEISLVLDISGSMNENIYYPTNSSYDGRYPTRMDKLRPAALTFVDKMFKTVQPASAPAGRLSISIVPYNQQVTLGPRTSVGFNLSTDHRQNTCADIETLPDGDFAISSTRALQRTMFGDSFDYWGQPALGQGSWTLQTRTNIANCPNASAAAVLAFANDQTTINTAINNLSPGGDTAIDVGARWGLALLDPAARGALNAMKAEGYVSSDLAGRPFDYDDGTQTTSNSSMKVLVLMTDGQNTRSYSTKPAYRTGASGFVSTYSATAFADSNTNSTWWNNLYYYSAGRSQPYYKLSNGYWYSSPGTNRYPISWETVWSKGYTLQYVINTFLYNSLRAANGSANKTSIYNDMAVQSEFSQKDTALLKLCDIAKDSTHGIYVFTVAVNAPTEGKTILSQCATSAGYAYDVNAEDLTNAFTSIASAINALRLTN